VPLCVPGRCRLLRATDIVAGVALPFKAPAFALYLPPPVFPNVHFFFAVSVKTELASPAHSVFLFRHSKPLQPSALVQREITLAFLISPSRVSRSSTFSLRTCISCVIWRSAPLTGRGFFRGFHGALGGSLIFLAATHSLPDLPVRFFELTLFGIPALFYTNMQAAEN